MNREAANCPFRLTHTKNQCTDRPRDPYRQWQMTHEAKVTSISVRMGRWRRKRSAAGRKIKPEDLAQVTGISVERAGKDKAAVSLIRFASGLRMYG